MIDLPDIHAVTALIRQAAEAEILPRYQCLAWADIREKGPGQLVTDADVEAERLLTRTLTALYPAEVVGEESVSDDAGLLAALERPGPVWVIDPVDGTANFAAGNPRFGVIVALVVDGVTVMGWIHDPIPNQTVTAILGQGSWLNDERLNVTDGIPLAAMHGASKRSRALVDRVARVARQGSAAHDYLDLAQGKLHFAHYRQLMPWDHAAGVLIHAEAGGFSAMSNGTAYRPVAQKGTALLLAPGRRSWDELKGLIEG